LLTFTRTPDIALRDSRSYLFPPKTIQGDTITPIMTTKNTVNRLLGERVIGHLRQENAGKRHRGLYHQAVESGQMGAITPPNLIVGSPHALYTR